MAGCNEGNVASQGEEVRHTNQIMTNYWGERNLWTTKIFHLYHMELPMKTINITSVKVENKYGSIVPKKQLISKDHERAYFDSADWVLGMAGTSSKTKTATESLKPKLKRTPHHQLPPRKPTCTSS
ncbi:uncharacterized protein LOC135584660 isoform X1 [Musa acuminata AAA Group]|uniref:uncharacterized protein LOC135584660 isoform X1 n=1 Tax=Musa acuminata AAA Group TaxID=214697 RepID=UPI0031D7D975